MNRKLLPIFFNLSPILEAINRHCPFEPSKWDQSKKSEKVFMMQNFGDLKDITHFSNVKHITYIKLNTNSLNVCNIGY